MKMNYRLIHNPKPKNRFDLWLPLLFIGMLVLFHFFYPTALMAVATKIATPFWSLEYFLEESTRTTFSFFSSKKALVLNTERLSGELAEANRLLLDRTLLLEENRLLKEQFGRLKTNETRILGEILATPPRSPYDTVLLDVGAKDGIAVGDLALSGSAVLGLIAKTHVTTSIVELFSTGGKKNPVSILHEGKAIPVEATGQGGGAFVARIPKEVAVSVGDEIVMPPFDTFVFASVVAIEGSDTDSFQTLRFKNPVAIRTLRYLEIRHQTAETSL